MNATFATPTTAPRPRVLADAIPGAAVRDAALVVGGAGLMALLAQVSIPVDPSPVPITGQTLGVGLVGATLGLRRGSASMLLYVLLGLLLPVYADGDHGWSVVWSANGGYLLGFILAAALVGRLAELGQDRKVATAALAFIAGQLLVFVPGVIGLKIAADQDWGWTIHYGFTVFIFGGLVKAAIGAAVLPSAWRLVRRFERQHPNQENQPS
jgi:biotin transport system substrate-specific component